MNKWTNSVRNNKISCLSFPYESNLSLPRQSTHNIPSIKECYCLQSSLGKNASFCNKFQRTISCKHSWEVEAQMIVLLLPRTSKSGHWSKLCKKSCVLESHKHKLHSKWFSTSEELSSFKPNINRTHIKFVLPLIQQLSSTKKHSRMSIVSTSMHFPINFALMFPFDKFLRLYSIEINPETFHT